MENQYEENVQKESIANTIIERSEKAAALAKDMVSRAESKLSSVMHPIVEENVKSQDQVPKEDYPPLFDKLRNNFYQIEKALGHLNKMFSNTEL